MSSLFINDVGTIIRIKIKNNNISGGSNFKIYYNSPDGTSGSWPATLYDSNTIEHIVQPTDFDKEGRWKIQGYVELPNWSGFTGIHEITVHKDLSVS